MAGSHPDLREYTSKIRSFERFRILPVEEHRLAREKLRGQEEGFHRGKLLVKGIYVSTVGLDETVVMHIQDAEAEDVRLEQLNLFDKCKPTEGGS